MKKKALTLVLCTALRKLPLRLRLGLRSPRPLRLLPRQQRVRRKLQQRARSKHWQSRWTLRSAHPSPPTQRS